MERKTKIIIIDGTDCSGKSTFIESLMKDKRFRDSMLLKNCFRPLDDSTSDRIKVLERYSEIVGHLQDSNYDYIVLDRYFISEVIYGKKRGYEEMSGIMYKMFEEAFIQQVPNHLFVCLNPGLETIKQRLAERGDEHVDMSDMQDLHERYNEFYNKTNLNKLTIDGWHDIKQDLNRIHRSFEEMEGQNGFSLRYFL